MEYTYEISKAIERRNEIEEQRLNFDKEVFEFNKQMRIEDTKANKSMAETLDRYTNMIQGFNDTIKNLANNQAVLYHEMQELKTCLKGNIVPEDTHIHAKWEIVVDDFDNGRGNVEYPHCSNCHRGVYPHDANKFCPNCGAIMDEAD